jgi:glucose-6-phosphate-specific signal transduction histidine kinase
MYWPLVVMGLGTALLAALIGWGMAARYGWQRALAVPVLALVALAITLWRASFLDLTDGIEAEVAGLAIAAPVLVGAFLGIVLAARRRK